MVYNIVEAIKHCT